MGRGHIPNHLQLTIEASSPNNHHPSQPIIPITPIPIQIPTEKPQSWYDVFEAETRPCRS